MIHRSSIRNLGLICMIGAAVFSLNGLWEIFQPSTERGNVLDPQHFRIGMLIFGFVCVPAFVAGQYGYYLSGAVGRSWVAKLVILISILGGLAYTCGTVIQAVTLEQSALFGVGITSTVLGCPFVLGLIALFVRTVRVWKRVWPLLLLIAPSIMFTIVGIAGWSQFVALSGNGLFWIVFGYAIYSEGQNTD